mmetsp:Transcript_8381/g.15222  ORF Transcript_8381/g.15222 Transcript_8381/m.15222 type:complete len:1111 (-) Transcript_8381:90-3422(-)
MSESEHYLQQLESAILHAATTGSQESSHRLDVERCQSTDGLAGACLELLRRRGWGAISVVETNTTSVAQCDAVAFYALTTLQRSPLLSCLPSTTAPPTDIFSTLRNQLRHLLLTTVSHLPNLHSMPNFVATKIGVLLALLVREEYPIDWVCPWRDVLAALNLSNDSNIALGKMASMGMYLSFLDAICDEIVYPAADDTEGNHKVNNNQRERIRREQVKDALRGFPIFPNILINGPSEPSVPLEHTDAANIVGWLLNVLTVTASQENTSDEVLIIAVRAAATLKRYLSWIDLRLAMNQNLVQILLVGLGGASSGVGDGDDISEEPTQRTLLAVECAYCLGEIVDRGMDEQKKLALLAELNIFGTLCHLARLEVGSGAPVDSRHHKVAGKLDLITMDATHIEAVAAAAELINTAGLALIQGWELDPTSQPTNMQMEQCLELVLVCLAYDSIDVSGAVVDLISRILVSLEKKEEYWNFLNATSSSNGDDTICNKIMSRILLILHMRMKYPTDFQFDYEDEEEAEEEIYRTHLRKLYQKIVRLRPQMVLPFIGQCLSSLPQPLSSSPTSDLEASLRLVYHYGEGRRPAPGAKTALKDAPFREMVMALHRSDVSSHPHREILLLYYDLSVRYSGILKETPELLTVMLASISGNRGLQHPHTRVRCRCCYLLLRLVKLVGANAMRPHVEVVVDGCQRLLFPPTTQSGILTIPPNEALYLFEATGILLGNTGLDTAVQVRCATAVLTPHIRSIEQTLQSPDLTRDVEAYGEQLSMSISAIAQLSKGWQKHPPPEVQTVLAAAVDVCRNVLLALPSSPLVRNRTAVLLQRMILCLGEGILPPLPSFFGPLLSYCTLEDDVLDVSQLINQLCIKFKDKAAPSVDSAILPFLQKVLAIQLTETTVTSGSSDMNGGGTNGISPPPHLITEQLSIRKQAFATLQHIVVHNVSAVLYSETNVASLGDVLQLMNDGATTVPDPLMNKTCTQFFCELIKQWGYDSGSDQQNPVPPTHVTNAFFDFVYGVFVPDMIRCILDTTFNVKDAHKSRVLAEYSRALWVLKQSRRGNAEFHSRVVELLVLGGNYAGGRKGSPAIANGFQSVACGKDIGLILKAWKEELKQQ